MQYGVLSRERFPERLPTLRRLGRFREFLEPGGAILYRNLFSERELTQAWELLQTLQPWQDRLECILRGEAVGVREVHDVVWCAVYLEGERACTGDDGAKRSQVGCPGARVVLGAGAWDTREEARRHALTFARVGDDGALCFDRSALAAYVEGGRGARCPVSPARSPQRFAAAFEPVSVRALGWPLVAELEDELRKEVGKAALEGEHGFVAFEEVGELEPHAALELVWDEGEVVVRGVESGEVWAREARLVGRGVVKVLQRGVRLRGRRVDESFVKRAGGRYEVEQKFVLEPRVKLREEERLEGFGGYRWETSPRATEAYAAWAERVRKTLKEGL